MKTLENILQSIRELQMNESFDLIVAIAQGGIIPAALLNQRLDLPFHTLHINMRDPQHRPRFDSPQLLRPIDFEIQGKRILLVEDRIKTGTTIRFACSLLESAALVRTFAINGKADYFLYDEDCFPMPWRV